MAESACNWAFKLIAPGFTIATHDSTGLAILPEGEVSCSQSGFRTPVATLNAFEKVYDGEGIYYDDQGFIVQNTNNVSLTFSGMPNEEIGFKVWYPDNETVQILGRGTVNGQTSEILQTITLDNVYNYGLISEDDLLPFLRRSTTMEVTMLHTNGTLYLTPPLDNMALKINYKVSASGTITRTTNPYNQYGEKKLAFINSNKSTGWINNGLFPCHPVIGCGWTCPVSVVYDDNKLLSINGHTIPYSNSVSSWWNGAKDTVVENAPKIELPDFTPKPPFADPDDPCNCSSKTVNYRELSAFHVLNHLDYDFIYNAQYGNYRLKDSTYVGYSCAATPGGYNIDDATIRSGNLTWQRYKEGYKPSSMTRCNDCGADDSTFGQNLMLYLGNNGRIKESWYGGAYGGEWVRVLFYDLSDPESYPSQCSEGGTIDFEDETIVVINGDSLLYPITIYTRGEIYLVGDFNVGHNAKARGIWDGDMDSEVFADKIAKGAIKGAAVVADANRIWFLTPWFAIADYGFKSRSSLKMDRKGLRGRTKYTDYNPILYTGTDRKVSGRQGYGGESLAGAYVGVFVTGAPTVDQGYYVSSRSHGNIELATPTVLERLKDQSLLMVGTEIHLGNAKLEADWNGDGYDAPDKGYWLELSNSPERVFSDPDGGIDSVDRYTWWLGKGHGDGFPPRKGRIAPRVGRGYYSFPFNRLLNPVLPVPPGMSNVIKSKGMYKK